MGRRRGHSFGLQREVSWSSENAVWDGMVKMGCVVLVFFW